MKKYHLSKSFGGVCGSNSVRYGMSAWQLPLPGFGILSLPGCNCGAGHGSLLSRLQERSDTLAWLCLSVRGLTAYGLRVTNAREVIPCATVAARHVFSCLASIGRFSRRNLMRRVIITSMDSCFILARILRTLQCWSSRAIGGLASREWTIRELLVGSLDTPLNTSPKLPPTGTSGARGPYGNAYGCRRGWGFDTCTVCSDSQRLDCQHEAEVECLTGKV